MLPPTAFFAAHHKNFNEDRHTLSAAKCRPVTLVSGKINYLQQIFEGLSRRTVVKPERAGVKMEEFAVFLLLYLRKFQK